MPRIVRSSALSACACSGECQCARGYRNAADSSADQDSAATDPMPESQPIVWQRGSSPQLHTRTEKMAHQSLCCMGTSLAMQNAQVGSVCGWSSGRYSGVSLLPSAAMATSGEPQVHTGTSSPEVTVTIWTVQHLGQAN